MTSTQRWIRYVADVTALERARDVGRITRDEFDTRKAQLRRTYNSR